LVFSILDQPTTRSRGASLRAYPACTGSAPRLPCPLPLASPATSVLLLFSSSQNVCVSRLEVANTAIRHFPLFFTPATAEPSGIHEKCNLARMRSQAICGIRLRRPTRGRGGPRQFPRGAGIRPALTLPGAVQSALGIPRSGQPQPPLRAFLARVGYPRHTATPARPLDGWFCRCHVSYHRSHAPCPRIRRRARRRSRPRIPSPSSRTRTRTVRCAH
jgi:hypothetical protein